jgi:hypothetical protein
MQWTLKKKRRNGAAANVLQPQTRVDPFVTR